MGLARRLGMCPSIQSLLILEALLAAISNCFSLLYGLKNLAVVQILDTFASLATCVFAQVRQHVFLHRSSNMSFCIL